MVPLGGCVGGVNECMGGREGGREGGRKEEREGGEEGKEGKEEGKYKNQFSFFKITKATVSTLPSFDLLFSVIHSWNGLATKWRKKLTDHMNNQ